MDWIMEVTKVIRIVGAVRVVHAKTKIKKGGGGGLVGVGWGLSNHYGDVQAREDWERVNGELKGH